jgi:DNA-directed RNA polymerase specialized sigma24 family protein
MEYPDFAEPIVKAAARAFPTGDPALERADMEQEIRIAVLLALRAWTGAPGNTPLLRMYLRNAARWHAMRLGRLKRVRCLALGEDEDGAPLSPPDPRPGPEQITAARERVAGLEGRDREIVDLVIMGAEMENALGVSRQRVHQLLDRALARVA